MNKKRGLMIILVLLGLVIASWGVFGAEKNSEFSKEILVSTLDLKVGDFYYQYNSAHSIWQYRVGVGLGFLCDYVSVGSVCGDFDPEEEISDYYESFRLVDSGLSGASFENGLTVLCTAAVGNNLNIQVEGAQASVDIVNIDSCVNTLSSLAGAETTAWTMEMGEATITRREPAVPGGGATVPGAALAVETKGCLNPDQCKNIDEIWVRIGSVLDISRAKSNEIWDPRMDDWMAFYAAYPTAVTVPVELTPEQKKMLNDYNNYQSHIDKAAKDYGVKVSLIVAIVYQESKGNPQAVSPAGAKGLMQLTEITITDINAGASKIKCSGIGINQDNVFDAEKNILAGTCYFSYLYNKYNKNLELALAAYNAGPGTVTQMCGNLNFEQCKSNLPPETQTYVPAVLNLQKSFEGIVGVYQWPIRIPVVLNSCFGKRSGSYKGSAVPDCTDGIDIDDGVPQKEGGVVDVYPVTSGTVIKVGTGCVSGNKECNGGYGNYVLIKHTDGRLSRYSHLYNINTNIRKGYPVNVNTVLGKIGNTGGSYGSHLDLKIYLNENMMGGDDPGVNPICYLSRGNVKSIIGSCDYMYNKDPWSICDTRINIQARDLCKTQTIPSGVG